MGADAGEAIRARHAQRAFRRRGLRAEHAGDDDGGDTGGG